MDLTKEKWHAEQTRGNNYFNYTLYRMVGVFPGAMASIEFSNSETAPDFAKLIAVSPRLLAFCENFFTWHANNFEDFDSATNDQLLVLANEAEQAIKEATTKH